MCTLSNGIPFIFIFSFTLSGLPFGSKIATEALGITLLFLIGKVRAKRVRSEHVLILGKSHLADFCSCLIRNSTMTLGES